MRKTVIARKTAENGIVKDTLTLELEALRKVGHSIFGINEGDRVPGTFGTRKVDIFYE